MYIHPISFLNLENYSPWPRRILGLEKWQVPVRDKSKILTEYDNDTYKLALNLWEEHFGKRDTVRPLQFYHQLDKLKAKQILENKQIYGAAENAQLISIKEDLFITDYKTACTLHYLTIANILSDILEENNIDQVFEPGCGNGINLFYLLERVNLKLAIGGEISPNAVALGNKIATKCNMAVQFQAFDYHNEKDLISACALLEGNYILFTCHSIEQVSLNDSHFIDNILRLKNPPKLVVHLEPVLDHDDVHLHSALAIKYSTINGYNQDLLSTLQNYDAQGKIKIKRFEKRIFGINAFNPTSLLVWHP
ncbi:MAG: class I SAM-dependent methyltransferase [Proteobacteria bacterium]|nr:class I SAM-dependent methyltransferase [Pseudomonadota bacterium]